MVEVLVVQVQVQVNWCCCCRGHIVGRVEMVEVLVEV
jgi:hypothetical protein